MIGSHFLKGWARTQNHVTMSSAEAELIALVKCSAELLGMRSVMKDWGVESSGVVYADAGFLQARLLHTYVNGTNYTQLTNLNLRSA